MKDFSMIKYANRLPPGKPVELLDDGLTVRKTAQCSEEKTLRFMEALANHFIRHPDPMVVPVYSFEVLKKSKYEYLYTYDMQRLGLLLPEERQLIDLIADLYDLHGKDACNLEWELYPGKHEFPKLFSFLSRVCQEDRYFDIHSGNVLGDEDGEYRLIDLEGFLRTPLELRENDWITRGE